MKVCIHRGTKEIGGTCIELEAQGRRIVLDLGLPLDCDFDTTEPPAVSGFITPDDSLLGVVISHPHQDHYGLLPKIRPEIPVIIGEAAENMLTAASFFVRSSPRFQNTIHLHDRQPLQLGPFTVTPYLVDHSAFDAYALLIEADGKRLFYTGDFRGHGRKRGLFERLLREPPPDIDVLLMEGTNVPAPGADPKTSITENALEQQMIESFKASPGIVLVSFSPLNVDRLVTVYKAALKSGREFVGDLYAATIAKATGQDSIPKPGFPKFRVFVPQTQQGQVKRAGTNLVTQCLINPVELTERRNRIVMLFRASMIGDLEKFPACLEGGRLVWSLWRGYLSPDENDVLQVFRRRHQIPREIIHHTSGHATLKDLQRFAEAMAAKRIVPIHTFAGDRFDEFFPRVARRSDGESWEV